MIEQLIGTYFGQVAERASDFAYGLFWIAAAFDLRLVLLLKASGGLTIEHILKKLLLLSFVYYFITRWNYFAGLFLVGAIDMGGGLSGNAGMGTSSELAARGWELSMIALSNASFWQIDDTIFSTIAAFMIWLAHAYAALTLDLITIFFYCGFAILLITTPFWIVEPLAWIASGALRYLFSMSAGMIVVILVAGFSGRALNDMVLAENLDSWSDYGNALYVCLLVIASMATAQTAGLAIMIGTPSAVDTGIQRVVRAARGRV